MREMEISTRRYNAPDRVNCTDNVFIIYSRTSMARTPLEPRKYVRHKGSSSE